MRYINIIVSIGKNSTRDTDKSLVNIITQLLEFTVFDIQFSVPRNFCYENSQVFPFPGICCSAMFFWHQLHSAHYRMTCNGSFFGMGQEEVKCWCVSFLSLIYMIQSVLFITWTMTTLAKDLLQQNRMLVVAMTQN